MSLNRKRELVEVAKVVCRNLRKDSTLAEKIFILKNETGITEIIETTIENLNNRNELLKLEGGREAFTNVVRSCTFKINFLVSTIIDGSKRQVQAN